MPQILAQILSNNLGNRITPELANGILHAFESAIAEAQKRAEAANPVQEEVK